MSVAEEVIEEEVEDVEVIMSSIDKEVASGVLSTIGIKEETSREEEGGNILDDILNTGDEKFEAGLTIWLKNRKQKRLFEQKIAKF